MGELSMGSPFGLEATTDWVQVFSSHPPAPQQRPGKEECEDTCVSAAPLLDLGSEA